MISVMISSPSPRDLECNCRVKKRNITAGAKITNPLPAKRVLRELVSPQSLPGGGRATAGVNAWISRTEVAAASQPGRRTRIFEGVNAKSRGSDG